MKIAGVGIGFGFVFPVEFVGDIAGVHHTGGEVEIVFVVADFHGMNLPVFGIVRRTVAGVFEGVVGIEAVGRVFIVQA